MPLSCRTRLASLIVTGKQMKKIGNSTLYCADCNDVLPLLKDIDACVTDPPYGLSFMGKQWDYDVMV